MLSNLYQPETLRHGEVEQLEIEEMVNSKLGKTTTRSFGGMNTWNIEAWKSQDKGGLIFICKKSATIFLDAVASPRF